MKTFKPSGVEWLGDIPAHWQVCRLKYLVKCLDGKRRPVDALQRVSGIYPYWGAGGVMDYVNEYIFDEKLILLGEDGAPFFDRSRPVAFLVNEKIWVNNHIHVLKALKNISSSFLVHCLNSVDYHQYINGSILNKLTQTNMKKIKVPCPPLDEQEKIAAYLDKAFGALDREIETQRALIDKLRVYKKSLIYEVVTGGLNPDVPKKFSGVEWLGEIPSHWQVCPLKYLCAIFSGTTPDTDEPSYWDGDIVWITPADFKTEDKFVREGHKSLTKAGFNSCSLRLIPPRSLIFSKRAPIGAVSINEVALTINQGCLACVPFDNFDVNFYFYVLATATQQFEHLGAGTTFKEISLKNFRQVKVPLPPLDEQKTIAAYLDRKCRLLDENISERTALVGRLSAYKKSLIYEVVTGKTEVGR